MRPVERFANQRHDGRPAPAEHDRVDRHACRILPLRGDRRVLAGGRREARVRVGRHAAGIRRPVLAGPVDQVGGRRLREALPPDVAVVGEGHVRVDAVAIERPDRVQVRLLVRAWRDAEEARLGVDRVEAAVRAGPHPADVVADRLHPPAGQRRDEHRQVRLAARGGERAGHVLAASLRRGHLDDQHVLREPALVAGDRRRDPQRVALLPEQRVAAVAGAVRPDLAGLREVDDVLRRRVAGPRHVGLAGRERRPDRVQARHVVARRPDGVERRGAHPGHDLHVDDDVGRVRDLDAQAADRRPDGPHRERDHVHGPAPHGAAEEVGERRPHLVGVAPVVGRARVRRVAGADERAVLDPRDVAGIRTGQEAVRPKGRIEPSERAGLDERVAERLVLGLGAVAPVDRVGGGERRDLVDPAGQGRDVGRGFQANAARCRAVRGHAAGSSLHRAHRLSPNL